MALDRLTKVDGGGISTTSDYRVGIITATKFVGPIEGDVTGSITATDGTFSGNVTIGGTLTYEDVTNIDSVGLITARNGVKIQTGTATTALVVEGNARVTGILTVGTGSITLNENANTINVGTALTLGHTQGLQFHTQNLHSAGFEVNQVNASGIITATGADINGDLDVDGHTNLDNVSISGVTTSGHLNINGDLSINDNYPSIHLNDTDSNNDFMLQNQNGTFTVYDVQGNADRFEILSDGTVRSPHYTLQSASPSLTFTDTNHDSDFMVQNANGLFKIYDTTNSADRVTVASNGNVSVKKDLDVDGHTELDNVNIAGVTTTGQINASGNITASRLTISSTTPRIYLTDTNNNDDFQVRNENGTFEVRNDTDGYTPFSIASNNTVTVHNDLDVDGHTNLDNVSIAGVTTFSGHLLPNSAGAVNIGSATAEIGDVYLASSKKAYFGSTQTLSIYNDGNNSLITDSSSAMFVRSNRILFQNSGGTEGYGEFNQNGSVYWTHDNIKRIETTATGIEVTGEVAATQDYPNFRPTLDFNFAAEKKLDPRITYQRTGPASFVNEFGKVVLVGGNVPRFDHDPTTRESKGLLIEESRTNLFLYGTTPGDNWTGSKAGTFEENTTETTAPDGTFTATKWTFTTTDPFLYQTTNLSANTSYTMSMWVKAGTNMAGDRLQMRIGGAPYSSGDAEVIPADGTWRRISHTRTIGGSAENSASVGFEPQTSPSGNPAVGDVMYIWGAQLEVGGFITSFIPTNGSTATRGADIVDVDGEDFTDFYNQSESTIISSHTLLTGVPNAENIYVYQIQDASTNNAIRVVDKNTSYSNVATGLVISGGSSVFHFNNTTDSFTKDKVLVALSVKNNDFAGCHNGGTIETDNSGTLPTNFNSLGIGRYPPSGGYELNGHIQRFIYYPKQLSDSQLKTLTS